MKSLRKREIGRREPGGRTKGRKTLLKAGAAAILAAAVVYFLPPQLCDREKNEVTKPSKNLERAQGISSRMPSKGVPVVRRKLKKETLDGLSNTVQNSFFSRLQSEFNHQSLDCGYVLFPPEEQLYYASSLYLASTFSRYGWFVSSRPSEELRRDIERFRDEKDYQALISVIDYLGFLNAADLGSHYADQFYNFEGGPVPDPYCIIRAMDAESCLRTAQSCLVNLILDGFADLDEVLTQFPEQQRYDFMEAFASGLYADMTFSGTEGVGHFLDTFERQYMSLSEPTKRLLESILINYARIGGEIEGWVGFQVGAENHEAAIGESERSAPEIQRILAEMRSSYEQGFSEGQRLLEHLEQWPEEYEKDRLANPDSGDWMAGEEEPPEEGQ